MSSIITQPPASFVGDVTLGAVELKDGTNTTRVDVITQSTDDTSNTANLLRTNTRILGFNGVTWDRLRSGQMTATSSFTGMLNTFPIGRYIATQPTLNDGQGMPFQLDVSGNLRVTSATLGAGEDLTNNILAVTQKPLAVSTYSPSLYSELTQVTTANIKASAGNVFSIYITNANAAVRYFQLHNKATAPAGTNVPIYSFPVPAGTANNPGVLILDDSFFTKAGVNFATGIGWAISTTYATFTDSATNTEHITFIHWI